MSELEDLGDTRALISTQGNEDAAVLDFPSNKALVQSLDYFTPIVNNPYYFGQIAAANSLSDIYAMGAKPYSVMNIVCFPNKTLSLDILKQILKGGMDKIKESGAIMCGGHSVQDQEIKYGLSVSGTVDRDCYASNKGIRAGDQLLFTKPLGTGILATAIKAEWENYQELERILIQWAAKLNENGAKIIRNLGLKAATDVTGFGLGGHLLEMARSAEKSIRLWSENIPIIPEAKELASMGLIPEGSYANKHFCHSLVYTADDLDSLTLDIIFDAQTSGGLVIAVPPEKVEKAREALLEKGDLAARIGEVIEKQESTLQIYQN